jgi:hypothetical protein
MISFHLRSGWHLVIPFEDGEPEALDVEPIDS